MATGKTYKFVMDSSCKGGVFSCSARGYEASSEDGDPVAAEAKALAGAMREEAKRLEDVAAPLRRYSKMDSLTADEVDKAAEEAKAKAKAEAKAKAAK